jgi:hypothetical protein
MDPDIVLREMEAALNAEPGPDAGALRLIRETLDDPALLAAIEEYIRRQNDPGAKWAVLIRLSLLMRRCGDLSARRKNQLTNLRFGIGAGGAAVVGSMIAIGSAAIPAFFIIPMFGGLWIVWACHTHTSRLSEEEQIYLDISGRMGKILETIDAQ